MSIDSLQAVLSAAWHGSHPVAPGNATVLYASTGHWQPATPRCVTPKAWLFLVGHWRAFSSTQRGLAHAINASTAGCFFCVLIVAEEIDVEASQRVPWAPKPGVFRDRGSVATLAQRAQRSFGGRLAYAVLRRHGALNSFEFCLHLNWYAGWAVARWAAEHHAIYIDAASAVVRTRPDVFLRRAFDAARLRRLFRSAPHTMIALPQTLADGRTLNARNKNDLIAVFSFGAYETGVALPIDVAGRMTSMTSPPPDGITSSSAAAAGRPYASTRVTSADTSAGDDVPRRTLQQARLLYERGVASGWGRMRAYFYDWRPREGRYEGLRTPVWSTSARGGSELGGNKMNASGLAWRRPCAERCVCVSSPWPPLKLVHAHAEPAADTAAPPAGRRFIGAVSTSSSSHGDASWGTAAARAPVACTQAGEVPSCLLASLGSLVVAQEFLGDIVRVPSDQRLRTTERNLSIQLSIAAEAESEAERTRLLDLAAGMACMDRILGHRHSLAALNRTRAAHNAITEPSAFQPLACPASDHRCDVEAESVMLTLWPHTSAGGCAEAGSASGRVVEITSLDACVVGPR